MAFESNVMTLIGNLTADPELRFTGGGAAVVSIRVAHTRKFTGRDGQEREKTLYMNANCWRDHAENVAESLKKGDRVIVIGEVSTRSYENKDGQTVYVTEIEASEIAPSLKWARAEVTKVRSGGNGGGNYGNRGGGNAPQGGARAATPDVDVDEVENAFAVDGDDNGADGPLF